MHEFSSNTDTSLLRVARRASGCRVLGPGRRGVVWFHGCSRGCPGCVAAEMNRSAEFTEESADALYSWVRSCQGIEGVTLSGGEPFEQPTAALGRFLALLREDERHLGVICFTGYTLEELRASKKACLLASIDVLVDGPYRDDLNDGTGLRGSSNQGIHFLTARYAAQREFFYSASARNLEFEVHDGERLSINGIPEQGFVTRFAEAMKAQGYHVNFQDRRMEK